MKIATFFRSLPFRRYSTASVVSDEADALIETWGDLAYQVAADFSWREDIGLLHVTDPGHWMRVTLEIGRRMQLKHAPPLDAVDVRDFGVQPLG